MAAEYLERMGARIAARREELGLTQEEVARELPGRVTGARVSLWERGKHRPRDDSLEALARVLQVDVSYFMAAAPDKTAGAPDLFGKDASIEERLDRIETAVSDLGEVVRQLAIDNGRHLEDQTAILEIIKGLLEIDGDVSVQDRLAELARDTGVAAEHRRR